MCRRHLHRTRPKLRLRQIIGDDRDLAIHQRQQNFLSLQMLVALVSRIHRNGRVAEHGLRPRGGHRDEFARTDNRIAYLVKLARNLLVLDFEIRNRRSAARAPVDDVLAAIDQSFFVQADEDFAHRVRKILVHREIFAVPIHRGAEPLHLLENRAAVMPLPFPDALNERLAPHVAAILALSSQAGAPPSFASQCQHDPYRAATKSENHACDANAR